MPSRMRFPPPFALVPWLILGIACGESGGSSAPDPDDAIALVTVTPSEATVSIGSSVQLHATVVNGRGVIVHVSVEWSSSSPSIATVDEDTGVVTGVSEGSVTVSGSAGGKVGNAEVIVTPVESTAMSQPGSRRFAETG